VLIGLSLAASMALYSAGMEKANRTYPNIPVEVVSLPADSNAIARGKHIATIWSCPKCHGANLGGYLMKNDPIDGTFPTLGAIPAPNLTSGKNGVGRTYSDADWVRAIRHGVKPDGRGEVLMYDYSALGDRDLADLIAYLKQAPPVDSDYREKNYGPLLPVAFALGAFAPAAEQIDHRAPRAADPVPGATGEYGKYISALCGDCHGRLVAPLRGGWTRADFTRLVRTGVLPNGTRLGAMPPTTYGEMNDTELEALWLYLQNPQSARAR
jgi:mono/diheme cytochrome c family protein